jgi:hypothetical protein
MAAVATLIIKRKHPARAIRKKEKKRLEFTPPKVGVGKSIIKGILNRVLRVAYQF